MSNDALIAGGTMLSAVAAIVAVIASFIIYFGQKKLSNEIAVAQEKLTKQIAGDQAKMSLLIHEGQTRLSQRQLIIPLWQYLSNLNNIDSKAPITPEILKVVNTLELVALCCEGEMVAKDVIRRTFSEVYLQLYAQIEAVQEVPGLHKSGRQLLMENRAATSFYDELRGEHLKQDKISSIQG